MKFMIVIDTTDEYYVKVVRDYGFDAIVINGAITIMCNDLSELQAVVKMLENEL